MVIAKMEKGRGSDAVAAADFTVLHEHARELIRGASSMPLTCDPHVVYSYGISEAAPEAAPEAAFVSASDARWRVCGGGVANDATATDAKYAISPAFPPGASAHLSLAPHNICYAATWQRLLSGHLSRDGSNVIEAQRAAQIERHVSRHALVVSPDAMLVTHGWMPWRPDGDSPATQFKIWRLSSWQPPPSRASDFSSAEVFPTMSEESISAAATATAATPAAAVERPKSYDAACQLYGDLCARIDALDARVWDPKHVTMVTQVSGELAAAGSAPRSKELTRFCNLLATLGKRVTEAEEAQRTKLADVAQSLAATRAALDTLAARTDLGTMLAKRRDSQLAKCAELEALEHNLVARANDVGKRAADVQKLVADVAKSDASATQPRSRAPKAVGASSGASSSTMLLPSSRAPPPLIVPTVDMAAAPVIVLRGKAQWKDVLARVVSCKLIQPWVVQHSDNAKLTDLWNRYQAVTQPLLNQVKQCDKGAQEELELDLTEASAYFTVLQQMYDADTSAAAANKAATTTAAAAAPTAPAATHKKAATVSAVAALAAANSGGGGGGRGGGSKRGECAGCEEERLLFCDGYCRECFVDEIVAERIDELNDKLRYLHELADNEDDEEPEEGAGEDADVRGPFQVLSDQMDALHDQIEAKYAQLCERSGRYSQWEDLKGLLAMADQHLAALPPPENDDDDGGDDDDNDGDGRRKKRGMWDGVELPPDDYDEPAVSTPTGSDDDDDDDDPGATKKATNNKGKGKSNGSKAKDGGAEHYELADAALRLIAAVPVASIHKRVLNDYCGGRFDSLSFFVRDTRELTKEIYGIKITDLRTGFASEWPTNYVEYDDALAHSARANIDGVMKAEVIKKPVAFPQPPAGGNGKE